VKVKFHIALLSVTVFAIVIGCAVSNRQSISEGNIALQSSVSPNQPSTSNPNEAGTVAFERTAIAIFTQNPTLALSSTPFYAEIIYNEVLRNLTEVPLPRRNCYLVATSAPGNSVLSHFECGALVATIMLGDDARILMELMNEAGIEGTIGGESTGVEGIDEAGGNRPFVAVQSRLGFAITVETIGDQTLLGNMISQITDILNQNWSSLKYVASNAEVYIQFDGSDGSKYVSTMYDTLKQVYERNLKGQALIQAIGDLKETPEQWTQ
jgi:hypothetical protein